ncbi:MULTISPECIES: class I SAM-dependent methyltransferase [unclassified Geodermatophilus]
MAIALPAFPPLEDSLYLTLCCRALDNRSPRPVLGDAVADEVVRALDYDYGPLHIDANLVNTCALRAKRLDEVASGFLARHPEAVGLDLGAGLDSRASRIRPPPTADWYDVDLPAVADARERVLPDSANPHGTAADVRDEAWLDALPTDRPAVVVADGLMGFLSREEMASLLDRLVAHFPTGEIAFNSYSRFAIWATKHVPGTKGVADLLRNPGFDDPREPERWNPRLHLVREILLSREPEIAQFPPFWRLYYRLSALSTSWSRKGTIVLHYAF